jgi:hypothetical protein
MADKFPLIFDVDNNKIAELSNGDNLDLQGNSVVNAVALNSNSIHTGSVDTIDLTVNGQQLAPIAFSGSYFDIPDRPSVFDGNYNALYNKPQIPNVIGDLGDVQGGTPPDGTFLVYKAAENRYTWTDVIPVSLENYDLNDLNDVVAINTSENSFLKYFSGAWRESNITWTDVKNKPTNISYFNNDEEYISKTELKSIVAESTDFNDFKNRIANDL